MIVLPKRKDIASLNMDIKNIYISQSKTLIDLKEKLSHLLKLRNIYSENLTKDNIRLWKLNPETTQQEVIKTISQIQTNERNTISVDFLTYLECN
jgi:hypothetical protein